MTKEDTETYDAYLCNHFVTPVLERDDTFLDTWYALYDDACKNGAAKVINDSLIPQRPVDFCDPDHITLEIYDSFAGKIPVIKVADTTDFENLVTNVIHKGNRPENIASTGASFAFGKSTRFIILSSKPYSNVTAAEMNLDEDDWINKSMIIRREHECNHYYTKWRYGVAMNHLHDELMADFFGIYDAFGYFKAEYLLRFLGVIKGSGDRLKVYIPDMNDELRTKLEDTATVCAEFLEKWSKSDAFIGMTRCERVDYLCSLGIEGMLSE